MSKLGCNYNNTPRQKELRSHSTMSLLIKNVQKTLETKTETLTPCSWTLFSTKLTHCWAGMNFQLHHCWCHPHPGSTAICVIYASSLSPQLSTAKKLAFSVTNFEIFLAFCGLFCFVNLPPSPMKYHII